MVIWISPIFHNYRIDSANCEELKSDVAFLIGALGMSLYDPLDMMHSLSLLKLHKAASLRNRALANSL